METSLDFETFRIELLTCQLQKLNSYSADWLKELLRSLTLELFTELLIAISISYKLYDELYKNQKMNELLAEQLKSFKTGGVILRNKL